VIDPMEKKNDMQKNKRTNALDLVTGPPERRTPNLTA
jgi:hypothetical protein